jgi:shikimate dehydrogenase
MRFGRSGENTIINRSAQRGEELARLVNERTPAQCQYLPWEAQMRIPEDTGLLVNATSIGLYPDNNARPNIDYDSLMSDMVVCDVVFNPPDTSFLQSAKSRGAQVINGLGMLVNQAAVNFTLWTSKEAPEELMARTLKAQFDPVCG